MATLVAKFRFMDALYYLIYIYIIGCFVALLWILVLNSVEPHLAQIPYTPSWYSWLVVVVMLIILIQYIRR